MVPHGTNSRSDWAHPFVLAVADHLACEDHRDETILEVAMVIGGSHIRAVSVVIG